MNWDYCALNYHTLTVKACFLPLSPESWFFFCAFMHVTNAAAKHLVWLLLNCVNSPRLQGWNNQGVRLTVVLSAGSCRPCPGISVGWQSTSGHSEASRDVGLKGHSFSVKLLIRLVPAKARFVPLVHLRVGVWWSFESWVCFFLMYR